MQRLWVRVSLMCRFSYCLTLTPSVNGFAELPVRQLHWSLNFAVMPVFI